MADEFSSEQPYCIKSSSRDPGYIISDLANCVNQFCVYHVPDTSQTFPPPSSLPAQSLYFARAILFPIWTRRVLTSFPNRENDVLYPFALVG